MKLNKIHHVAVICSDYEQSKQFYTEVLGLKIVSEHYRENRQSWKADCMKSKIHLNYICLQSYRHLKASKNTFTRKHRYV